MGDCSLDSSNTACLCNKKLKIFLKTACCPSSSFPNKDAQMSDSWSDAASPDRSPNPRLHRRALNLAAFSGFRRGLRGSVPRRQHFGDRRTASRENKTESSAGGLPSARVSGTGPTRLVLPAPGGCDAAQLVGPHGRRRAGHAEHLVGLPQEQHPVVR